VVEKTTSARDFLEISMSFSFLNPQTLFYRLFLGKCLKDSLEVIISVTLQKGVVNHWFSLLLRFIGWS